MLLSEEKLASVYTTGHLADVTLSVLHEGGDSTEVYRFALHRLVLYAGSAPLLRHLIDGRTRDFTGGHLELRLDCTRYSRDVLTQFFALLYRHSLAAETFAQEQLRFIDENALQLHQLALYFGFDALVSLCEARLAYHLDACHFPLLRQYCHSLPHTGGSAVHRLSQHLDSWYRFCGNDDVDIASSQRVTCHYHRICRDCLFCHRQTFRDTFVGDLGNRDNWSFFVSFTRDDEAVGRVRLYTKCHYPAEAQQPARVRSSARLFSRDLSQPVECVDTVVSPGRLAFLLTLPQVTLHPRRLCYEAPCHHCGLVLPVYIFEISIEVVALHASP